MLISHYIDTPLGAGMNTYEINEVPLKIAGHTIVAEFWVLDGGGRVECTNNPDVDFTFPPTQTPEPRLSLSPSCCWVGKPLSHKTRDPASLKRSCFSTWGTQEWIIPG